MEEEEGKLLRNEIIKCLSEENWEIVKEILQLLMMLLGVFSCSQYEIVYVSNVARDFYLFNNFNLIWDFLFVVNFINFLIK